MYTDKEGEKRQLLTPPLEIPSSSVLSDKDVAKLRHFVLDYLRRLGYKSHETKDAK